MEKEEKLKPMRDETADFNKCFIKTQRNGIITVYCKEHGAMICVRNADGEKMWRCVQAISLITGKCENDCKAGCVSYLKK